MSKYFSTILAALSGFVLGIFTGGNCRAFTRDVAITYRMQAGFPGDVNRTHPFSVLPGLPDGTDTLRAFGELLLFTSSNTLRPIKAADQSDATAIKVAGALVRPYPTQQMSGGMTSAFGAGTPPTTGVVDFLRSGYIFSKMKAGVAVKRGDPVWVWAVATAGANIQGELQAAVSAGNTVPIANARFMGPADANGVVEIEIFEA